MPQLQLISSVFVLTVNLVCSLVLWTMCRGSRPKRVLALLSTLLTGWNLFAVLLLPELRFDRLSFHYLMATTSGAALIYIYLQLLMSPARVTLRRIVGLYGAPAVLAVAYLGVRLVWPHVELEAGYRDIRSYLDSPELWLRIAAGGCFLVYFLRVVFLVARLWPEHRRRIAGLYSWRERIGLGWVPFVAALFVVYGSVVVVDVFFGRPGSVQTVVFNFFFAGFYLTLNLMGVRQQDVYTYGESTDVDDRQPPSTAVMNSATRRRLRQELPGLMETHKVYLDPELRLDTVATMLNTNRTYISTVLNDDLGKSFIVWVNEYRVEEAKRQMTGRGGREKSISEIAEKSGFKSNSSFTEFFRRQTGISPGKFRSRLMTHDS